MYSTPLGLPKATACCWGRRAGSRADNHNRPPVVGQRSVNARPTVLTYPRARGHIGDVEGDALGSPPPEQPEDTAHLAMSRSPAMEYSDLVDAFDDLGLDLVEVYDHSDAPAGFEVQDNGAGELALTGATSRATINPSCPAGEPPLGWNSTCEATQRKAEAN